MSTTMPRTTSAIIDHLQKLLEKRLSKRVSKVYYGDIGVYQPSVFKGQRNEQKAVIAITPRKDTLDESSRTAAHENRILTFNILVMVDMTPYFSANPPEAVAERELVETVEELKLFLTQLELTDLGGRVRHTKVVGIDYDWVQRKSMYLRAAMITYEVFVTIPRNVL